MEALRNIPVTGLDYGSLFDHAPAIRVAVCKALQLESDKQLERPKARAKGPSDRVVNAAEVHIASCHGAWRSSLGKKPRGHGTRTVQYLTTYKADKTITRGGTITQGLNNNSRGVVKTVILRL